MTSQNPSSGAGATASIQVYDSEQETYIAVDLAQAYTVTNYVVHVPQPFTLKIGVHSPELGQLLKASGTICAAFLTASNPYSEQLSQGENENRNRSLADALAERGHVTVQGLGVDPSGTWQPEQSVLVLGLTKADAAALGRRFGQNAVVWCNDSATPELLLLR